MRDLLDPVIRKKNIPDTAYSLRVLGLLGSLESLVSGDVIEEHPSLTPPLPHVLHRLHADREARENA